MQQLSAAAGVHDGGDSPMMPPSVRKAWAEKRGDCAVQAAREREDVLHLRIRPKFHQLYYDTIRVLAMGEW